MKFDDFNYEIFNPYILIQEEKKKKDEDEEKNADEDEESEAKTI